MSSQPRLEGPPVSLDGGIGEIGPAAADRASALQERLGDGVLRIAGQMTKAEVVCVGVIALRERAIGNPHLRPRAVEELLRHDLSARRRKQMNYGRCRDERPLSARLSLDAGRGLVAGDHQAVAHDLGDFFRAFGNGFAVRSSMLAMAPLEIFRPSRPSRISARRAKLTISQACR
jgi:hypothetical protein